LWEATFGGLDLSKGKMWGKEISKYAVEEEDRGY